MYSVIMQLAIIPNQLQHSIVRSYGSATGGGDRVDHLRNQVDEVCSCHYYKYNYTCDTWFVCV